MQQIDCKQEQNVWSRVLAAQTQTQPAPANAARQTPQNMPAQRETMETSLTPEQVLSLMEAEMQDAATYRALSCRMTGCAKKTLEALAQDERCHRKKLAAMYFLLTGKKACPPKQEPPCITCNAETLRRQYQKELAAREQYEALAPLAGGRACTLREIALDECRHTRKIYELLQNCL